jgi:hypothetical protein
MENRDLNDVDFSKIMIYCPLGYWTKVVLEAVRPLTLRRSMPSKATEGLRSWLKKFHSACTQVIVCSHDLQFFRLHPWRQNRVLAP